jgi:hypothetical protein
MHEDNLYYPVWELEEPHGREGVWVLWIAKHHPTYQAAVSADRNKPTKPVLFGTTHFWADTFCSAILEWALRLYEDNGDEGGFKLLTTAGDQDPLWTRYQSKIQELIASSKDPILRTKLQREAVGLMLYFAQERLR